MKDETQQRIAEARQRNPQHKQATITPVPRGAVAVNLGNGGVALVDAADYPRVSERRWRRFENCGIEYAHSFIPGSGHHGKYETLHRFIMNALPGLVIDHINGDGLDNRGSNLRICTPAQNSKNKRVERRGRPTSSKFKGVTRLYTGAYRAQIQVDGKKLNLGRFLIEEEAARAYDRAAHKHHGEFARFNFPEEKVA